MATFRERCKEAMEIRGVRASELSERSGISKSSLSHYLKGEYEPKQDRIYLISQALMVDPVWLMGVDGVPMTSYEDKLAESLACAANDKRLGELIIKMQSLTKENRIRLSEYIEMLYLMQEQDEGKH